MLLGAKAKQKSTIKDPHILLFGASQLHGKGANLRPARILFFFLAQAVPH